MKRRKLNRLNDYDYSQNGYYFVTICTKNRKNVFGDVEEGMLHLNAFGEIANQCWHDLTSHYLNCLLDCVVIMPNHVHGIVAIDNERAVGNGFKPFPTHGLSEIIRGFKSFSSRRINEKLIGSEIFKWQKSFYDHIVRDERSLDRLRHYIRNNPSKWDLDKENPASKNFNLDDRRYWREVFGARANHEVGCFRLSR